MIYPAEVDQIVERACSLAGIVYVTNNHKIFALNLDDEALACLMTDDVDGAINNGIGYGKNVWVIQWYGEGVKGVRDALKYLGRYVGKGGVMAGNRKNEKRYWSKEWLDKRR